MRLLVLMVMICALAACGGRSVRAPAGVTFASGPISQACLAAGRANASRPLCTCVQGVANQSLSDADQRRAARFFDDPQLAQDTRQADGAGAEAFWQRYTAWADRAASLCQSVA